MTVHVDPRLMADALSQHLDLRQAVSRDAHRIVALLPAVHFQVTLREGKQINPRTGEGGYTDPASGRVTIQVASGARLTFVVRRTLARALAYESHHALRIIRGPGFGNDLLEWLVSEGSAGAFAVQAFPGPPEFYDVSMTSGQVCAYWRRASVRLDQAPSYYAWFFGYHSRIPRWTGFNLGYRLIEAYLHTHPGTTAARLALLPAHQILRDSQFHPCGS